MITDLALTIAAIVFFLIPAELAWRPFQRRHIGRPLPTDPTAQAANIGGIIGGGCVICADCLRRALQAIDDYQADENDERDEAAP